jgi:murein DD-endopeptidase MepM/ murein hydrolase activator NlpD
MEVLIQKKSSQQILNINDTEPRSSFWLQRSLMFAAFVAVLGNVPVSSHLLNTDDSSATSITTATLTTTTTKSFEITLEDNKPNETELSALITTPLNTATPNNSNDKQSDELLTQNSIEQESIVGPQELTLPTRAIETYAGHASIDANSKWKTYHVKSYDNLTNIFHKLGHQKSLKELQNDPKISEALKKLKKGSIARAKSLNGKLAQLIFTTNKESFVITAKDDGYEGVWKKNIFETRQARASFTINNGLFFDGRKAGISDKIVKQVVKVFDWDIDFSHDVRIGDNVTAVFEEIYHDGDKVDSGHLLAAEFINKGHAHRAVRYTFKNGKSDYFTPQGREMKKAFIRTPVAHARVSSHFNPGRFHPKLHKIRAHKGTDFAARTGTAIMATGNGKVKFIGRKGGYGRVVIIQHREGYSTLYAHMSRFKKGIKKGDTILQGDTIGYVGRSGLATGPHLHYEFRQNGKPVNPMTASLPNSMSLDRKELKDFRNHAINLVLQLNVLHRFAKAKIEINSAFGG